jgi:hypothetical protein
MARTQMHREANLAGWHEMNVQAKRDLMYTQLSLENAESSVSARTPILLIARDMQWIASVYTPLVQIAKPLLLHLWVYQISNPLPVGAGVGCGCQLMQALPVPKLNHLLSKRV